MNSQAKRVAIVGAGIAGLAAAFRMKQAGLDAVVFEASDYAGGRIKSFRRGEFLYDVGAFIYLGSYTQAVDMMRDAGLSDQIGRFDAYGAMPRDGQLHFLDLNKPIRTILGSGYLSAGAKLRAIKLFALLAKHWKDLNYHDGSAIAAIDTDSVNSWCDKYLDAELRDYLAGVVVRGPWLADPSETSIAMLLWTLKNFFKPWFYNLRDGMDALPRALAKSLDVRFQHEVLNVANLGHEVEVTYRTDGQEKSERFDRALLTTTTDRLLEIYPQVQGVQRQFFETNEYISSVNTHLALRRRPANPATYIMNSMKQDPDWCGVIVDHLKAEGRVPPGKGMITVFCRHQWCVKHLDAPAEVILKQVIGFLRPYYGDLTEEIEDYEIGRWPLVVPIMRAGRFKAVAEYQKTFNPTDRVQFAGDLVPMGGVNAALVSGEQAAQRLAAQYD